MPVPAAIITEVMALNTALTAAGDLDNADQATLAALTNSAISLTNDTDAALAGAAGALDTGISDIMAPAIVNDFLSLVDAGGTQLAMADLRGVAGRMATNLTNG